jgi:hypothetical protein
MSQLRDEELAEFADKLKTRIEKEKNAPETVQEEANKTEPTDKQMESKEKKEKKEADQETLT